MSGRLEKLSFKELLDEYFYERLAYWEFLHSQSNNDEIGSILIQNYQEYEAEIERRMFEYESCKED